MSYRDMTKPLVHKIDGQWGFTCCIGSALPTVRGVRREERRGAGNPVWSAAVRMANVHAEMFHKGQKATINYVPLINFPSWMRGV